MLLTQMRKTMRDDEAGQALVLGAITMLVLAMAVLVTINIGHAIDERVQLQNAADSAAFSTATVVARSLNFISFVNRTIATQFVSAMAVQTFVAAIDGLEAFIGIIGDLVQTLASLACIMARICQVLCAIPWTAAFGCPCQSILSNIYPYLERAAQALWQVADIVGQVSDAIDSAVAYGVQFIVYLNKYAMFNAQRAMRLMTVIALAGAAAGAVSSSAENFQLKLMRKIAGEKVNSGGGWSATYDGIMGVENGLNIYKGMFSDDSENIPDGTSWYNDQNEPSPNGSGDDPGKRAERLMAMISNASRLSSNGSDPTWESGNGLNENSSNGVMAKVAAVMSYIGGLKFQGSTRLVTPMAKNTFCEEDCGGNASNDMSGQLQDMSRKQQAASDAKQACDDAKTAEANAKTAMDQAKTNWDNLKAQCQSDSGRCPSSPCNPTPQSCTNANQAQTDYYTAQDNYNSAVAEKNRLCGIAERKANDAQNSMPTQSQGLNPSGDRNYAFMNYPYKSEWSRGTAMAAAEYVKAGGALSYVSGGGAAKIVGVQSAKDSSDRFHCRYDGRDKYTVPSCPDYAWTKNVKCEQEDKHEFWGPTAYLSLKIDNDSGPDQWMPSFAAAGYKSSADARLNIGNVMGFGESEQKVELGSGNTASFKAGKLGGDFFDGVHAWAHARAYYHRPGAAAEPPNLFNPYWRAKLSPVRLHSGISQLVGGLGLSPDQLKAILIH